MDEITIKYQDQHYTASYKVKGDTVSVFHSLATNSASLGGLPAEGLARQLLFEIVARKGLGVPDPIEPPAN